MELELNYTLKDYIRANRLHARADKSLYFIISFGFLFLLYAIFLIVVDPAGIFTWPITLFSLVMMTYPVSVIPLQSKRYMKKQKYFDGPIRLKFEDNSIFSDSPAGESKIKWIHKVVTGKGLLLIYTTPKNFIMIPEKYCTRDARFRDIIRFVKEMPGSGKVVVAENFLSRSSSRSFGIAVINLFVFLATLKPLARFGADADPAVKLLTILWGLSVLFALWGIVFGIRALMKKEGILLAALGVILNAMTAFLTVAGLFPR